MDTDMLLDYVDDDDVVNEANIRVIDQPWATWTEEDKKILMNHINYHTKWIEFINKCWTSGLTKDKVPEPPKSDIKKLVKKGRKRKGSLPESKKRPKVKPKSFNEMTDEEFNDYLMGKRRENTENTVTVNLTATDLKSVAVYINDLHEKVLRCNLASLLVHLEMGNGLIRAKEIFDNEKKEQRKQKKKTTETWVAWIEKNTPVKESYGRQLREIARLVSRFPNLENLAVTYTELYNMRKKIKDVFTRNPSFYEHWRGKQ